VTDAVGAGGPLRYVKAVHCRSASNTSNASVEIIMGALKELFTSDVGLLSLGVIVFIIGMGVFFIRFFQRQMNESERASSER
jgi:hypothetical protein